MAVVSIDFHNMPKDRLATDWNHGLWSELGFFAQARASPATQNHDFHLGSHIRNIRATLLRTGNLRQEDAFVVGFMRSDVTLDQ